jgi:hypothetical protein
MSNATETKGTALSALKALSNKGKVETTSKFAANVNDVAILGATRDGKSKSVVKLGLDPEFTKTALSAAKAKEALNRAEQEFEIYQGQLRDYGVEKRRLWNSAYKDVITTVCVPYEEQAPDGLERKFVQVTCSSKYSIRQETVLQLKDDLGDSYSRLFKEQEEKILKPNCEEIVRGLLKEMGLDGEELENSMSSLFETKLKISATERYEQESEKLPEEVRKILDQAVTRSAPALKFP